MSNSPEEIISRLRQLEPVALEHEAGFTAFTQFAVETSGLEPEAAEEWILANGGQLKHVRIPEVGNVGRGVPQPDSAPCYFVPDELLALD